MLKCVLIFIAVTVVVVTSFNLSPIPNITLVEPILNNHNFIEKVESSYFGYSLVLHKQNIMISAPRAQTSIMAQRTVNETGAIYQCGIKNNKTKCILFLLDDKGNGMTEEEHLLKDHQMFGAAMDGPISELNEFVACAPNIITRITDYSSNITQEEDYLYQGMCYTIAGTNHNEGHEIKKKAIVFGQIYETHIRLPFNISKNSFKYNYLAQFGFSVNIIDDRTFDKILYGAPGFDYSKGNIFLIKKNQDDFKESGYEAITAFEALKNKPEFSYFGYAVTSAKFHGKLNKKICVVAAGPKANDLYGEVIIFGIDSNSQHLKALYTFEGPNYGEYFGYSLLADDFNGDGVIDMAISAPFHRAHQHDDGCVYIYINKGKDKFLDFKLQSRVLTATGSKGHAQFGTTLAKIGDINRDGFNDIAVGAPFETDGGAVYIFLGGQNGIDSVPSQIIRAPESRSQLPWFGYGISKGVDIDNNGHNDLAIGAPNIDEVYIYKAYPTIKINSTINVPPNINVNTTAVKLSTCMSYVAGRRTALKFEVVVTFKIELDLQLKRAKFQNGQTKMEFNITLKTKNVCKKYEISLNNSLSDIYKPINITLQHKLPKKYHEMVHFCEDCVALNPKEPTSVQSSIQINTSIFLTNLKLRVKSNDTFYLLGSASHIEVTFSVENRGDIAHDPKIAVYLPTHASFYLFPSWCERHNSTFITCSLRASLMPKEVHDLNLYINLNELDIGVFQINANATSSGIEEDPTDNIKDISINCTKFSDIQVIGSSLNNVITIEELGKNTNETKITHSFEIWNYGPSTIRDLDFIIIIPSKYFKSVLLIERETISITGKYDNRDLKWAWADPLSSVSSETHKMTKRSYNRYTRAVTESTVTSSAARNTSLDVSGLNSFAKNRTIFFNCSSSDHDCLTVVLKIENFYGGDKEPAAKIKVVFTLDEQELISRKIFNKTHDTFIMALTSRIANNEVYAGSSLEVKVIDPITVFVYRPPKKTPMWIIIASVIIGIIILTLITFALYKMQFFHRSSKDEILDSKAGCDNDKQRIVDNIELNVVDDTFDSD